MNFQITCSKNTLLLFVCILFMGCGDYNNSKYSLKPSVSIELETVINDKEVAPELLMRVFAEHGIVLTMYDDNVMVRKFDNEDESSMIHVVYMRLGSKADILDAAIYPIKKTTLPTALEDQLKTREKALLLVKDTLEQKNLFRPYENPFE